MARNKLETTLQAINGGLDTAILTGKSPIYQFDGGKKTSDTPIGTRIDLALQGNRATPLSVKILGADPLPKIMDEDIVEAVAAMAFPLVHLTNCVVSIYTINGNLVTTATADGVTLVEPKK